MATYKNGPDDIVREIKRKTRRIFNSEEKIRIVLEGLREERIRLQKSVEKKGSIPVNTTSGARSFWKRARND